MRELTVIHRISPILGLVFLFFAACSSNSEYDPKRLPIRAERPEISFGLVQASDGAMKVKMTNNGTIPFLYYSSFAPHYPYHPDFRPCERTGVECGGTAWRNPNKMVSQLIALPAKSAKLEVGGTIERIVDIASTLAMGRVYGPDPDARLQIRLKVMVTPYFEEYIEYVSEWMLAGKLMRP
jgi:hypothetical protein